MADRNVSTRYLCVSAYVRALENRLVTESDLNRMIDAAGVDEAARILTDDGYEPMEAETEAALEQTLRAEREKLMEDLRQFLPDQSLLDLFRIRYDYHNAKVAVKAAATGASADRLLMSGGRFAAEEVLRAVQEGEESILPQHMADAVREALETVASTGDPQLGDFLLDRAYFAELTELAAGIGSQFLTGYVELMVDAANLRTLIRVLRLHKDADFLMKAVCPGGRIGVEQLYALAQNGGGIEEVYRVTDLAEAAALGAEALGGGSLTAFERACDDTLTHALQEAKLIPFGLEPVVAYLAAKEQELQNVRIVMSGRLAGLRPEIIRERMREAYV